MTSTPIGIEIPGRVLAYWPGNPLEVVFDWDVTDPTGGHTWAVNAIRGDAGRPSARWGATVVVDGQEITATWDAVDTAAFTPGTFWQLLRDDETVLAGKLLRGTPTDVDVPTLTVQIASPQVVQVTVTTGLDGPAPSTEQDYKQITADITAITIDALNIDLLSGLSTTVPDVPYPVYVWGIAAISHSVANATVNPVLCKTSPAPATILDAIAMGFVALSAIGSKANGLVVARIPPNTPCTVQMYLSGTGGVAAISAQLYAPSKQFGLSA